MARSVAEIETEMAALKAAGEHPRSGLMRGLRAALDEARGIPNPTAGDKTVEPEVEHPAHEKSRDVKQPGPPPEAPAFDVRALVMATLAARAATGKSVGHVEQLYSAVREAAEVGAIIMEALSPKYAGWLKDPEYANYSRASGIPPWAVLGREKYEGRKFKPGETQLSSEGIVAPPSGRAPNAEAAKANGTGGGGGSDRDKALGLLGRPSLASIGLGGDGKATISIGGVPPADE